MARRGLTGAARPPMARAMSRRLAFELLFLLGAPAAALALRTFAFSVYAIPSESMLPALMAGDYLLVWKWPFSRGAPVLPRRGDIVVFHAPPAGIVYVKRVIGLPGDRVALRAGALVIDGRPAPRWRVADFVVPVAPNSPCRPAPSAAVRMERAPDGESRCRSPRFREALPDGRLVDALDLGPSAGDAFGPVTVPAGRLFLLGDDRDRSADSRWPAGEDGGIGMVPASAVIGRAVRVLVSVDGRARLTDPATWAGSLRWSRIGLAF